ncbi:MAG: hypothetical protein HOJ35_12445 [Bdellovibrionales bacterium]|jgi:hypothetical protein|nr:hypothetical protein [Bdellovibrionales bacterium]
MLNKNIKISFLLFFFSLGLGQTYAQDFSSQLKNKVPPHIFNKINRNIIHLENSNYEHSCPTGHVWDRKNFNSIEKIIRSTSFVPECIWGTIDKNAKYYVENKVVGFSFGSVLEASLFIGTAIGTELVVIPWDDNTLMVGMVRFQGGSLSASLSGGSLTQSVIYGKCKNGILGYLGLFQSKAMIAMMQNTGVKMFFGKRTGCNSITSVRGSTSPIVGVALTIYEQLGNFAFVQGPGVQSMLDYIKALNE